MSAAKLLPCPFCGGKRVKLGRWVALGAPHWAVVCPRAKCGAVGPMFVQTAAHQVPDPELDAIDAWNRRARIP